jgi:hypothetical protein
VSAADPWEHFTEQDRARVQGLPLEVLAFTLLDEATPRASAKQLSDALEIPPRDGKRLHAAWKAARASGRTQEDEHAALEDEDVRDKFEREFKNAFEIKDYKSARDLVYMLAKIEASGLGRARERKHESEDWTRLSDGEAAMLVALVRKVNGETLTVEDGQWLGLLPP